MLIYEQEISSAVNGVGGLISYGSAWRACIALVRIQLRTEHFCERLPPDNYIYIYILSVYKHNYKKNLRKNYYIFYFPS